MTELILHEIKQARSKLNLEKHRQDKMGMAELNSREIRQAQLN